MRYVLSEALRAIPVRYDAGGCRIPGVITQLPRNAVLAVMGGGLVDTMLEVAYEGQRYCVFRDDLEDRGEPAAYSA